MAGKQDALTVLYDAIKERLERNGTMQKARNLIQTKVVAVLKENDSKATTSSAVKNESPVKLVTNQLLMEYLKWFGYQYTAEMFEQESGTSAEKPLNEMRKDLEDTFGQYDHPTVPISLQIIDELIEKNKEKERD